MEYRGFTIGQDLLEKWFIVFPSGFKAFPPDVASEQDVKDRVDALIAELGAPE